MEILTNIVANLEARLTEFIGIAERRFPSWRGTDNVEILKAAVERAYLTAHAFPHRTARDLLKYTLVTRVLFEELRDSYKQGEFTGACLLGDGQEAVGAGVALAMRKGDYLAPEHRSFSAMLAHGTPLDRYWRNFFMRATGPTGGYDPNIHFPDLERRNFGFMVSDMAMSAGVINGAVFAENQRLLREKGAELLVEERASGVAIFGDGAASNGLAHEGMNLAKALRLPILFVILNNQIALRTHPNEEHGGIDLANRAFAYEMPALTVDGNSVLDVYFAAATLLDFARRAGHPALLHAVTFRRCGHNETERTDYVAEMFDKAFLERQMSREKDAVYQARTMLDACGFINEKRYRTFLRATRKVVARKRREALAEPEPVSAEKRAVFMDPECRVAEKLAREHPASATTRILSFRDAIREALLEEFAADPRLVMIGEDIARGGIFEVTNGLPEKVGRERIINSPLSEGAISAFGVGAAMTGVPTIVEFQFWDFALSAPSPMLTLASTRAFMQKTGVPIVFRGPCAYAPQSNHYHEKIPEGWLANAHGIKIVVPSTPRDAKGLLKSAVRDPDPVAFLEEMSFYGARGEVPEGEYFEELKPKLVRTGEHITLITWFPKMLHLAAKAADELAAKGIEVEIIDLRVLNPLDREFIYASVKKTGRVIVLHEDSEFMGFGAQIESILNRDYDVYYSSRARPRRLAAKNTPIPAHLALEDARLPQLADITAAAEEMMEESQ
ncbi:MAG: hypothetical protein HYS44_02060 [Candidatus Niyogibacteria bacterium]|nr:hypothetical protein [Candidatus Niyogibacteria bacterium]